MASTRELTGPAGSSRYASQYSGSTVPASSLSVPDGLLAFGSSPSSSFWNSSQGVASDQSQPSRPPPPVDGYLTNGNASANSNSGLSPLPNAIPRSSPNSVQSFFGQGQDLAAIRATCAQNRTLYEDTAFPADNKSLFLRDPPRTLKVRWLRPAEISRARRLAPSFAGIVQPQVGLPVDLERGPLADAWLFTSLASLVEYPELLRAVIPDGQGFGEAEAYCGVFLFRFWRADGWQEILVDDWLPCELDEKGIAQPLGIRSRSGADFLGALLEKAYAKLYGSYEAIKSLSIREVLTDLTAGMLEVHEFSSLQMAAGRPKLTSPELAAKAAELNNLLFKAFERQSIVGAFTPSNDPEAEGELANGLITRHPYSITDIKEIRLIQQFNSAHTNPLADPNEPQSVTLLRVRNQLGRIEWRGDWSIQSQQWNSLSAGDREAMGLLVEDESEFWIDLRDLISEFSLLFVCNLPFSPTSLTDALWHTVELHSSWIRYITSGGAHKFSASHWQNPQFHLILAVPDMDEYTKQPLNECSLILELVQGNRAGSTLPLPVPRAPPTFTHIGFAIYAVDSKIEVPLSRRWLETHQPLATASTSKYVNLRARVQRLQLVPGEYVIIPSTFSPHSTLGLPSLSFSLRCFFEQANQLIPLEEQLSIPESPGALLPERDSQLTPSQTESLRRSFLQLTNNQQFLLDAISLVELLNREFFRLESGAYKQEAFSFATSKSIILLVDADRTSLVAFHQFMLIWNYLRSWKRSFQALDRARSARLSAAEAQQAFRMLGLSLPSPLFARLHWRCSEQPQASRSSSNLASGDMDANPALAASVNFDLYARMLATLLTLLVARSTTQLPVSKHLESLL